MKKLNSLNLPWPTRWSDIFGTERPLIVEIGFGNGQHLMHLAQQNPAANLIGIEISNQSLEKAERNIVRLDLDHVRVIHTWAETALHHVFAPQTVSAFHINYPDPWFKTRHSGRRLMQRDTLDTLVSRLTIGGLLYLATDIVEYAEMSHELLAQTPGLDNQLSQPWVNSLPDRFITKYEAKGIREGRPGNYFVYRRNNRPAPDVPVMKEVDMPHVVLQIPVPLEQVIASFARVSRSFGDIHVTLMYAYVSSDKKSALFEAHVVEPTIEQHVAFVMIHREDRDDYVLRLTTIGNARPTEGIHRAAAVIADWVASQHPEIRVIDSKIRRA